MEEDNNSLGGCRCRIIEVCVMEQGRLWEEDDRKILAHFAPECFDCPFPRYKLGEVPLRRFFLLFLAGTASVISKGRLELHRLETMKKKWNGYDKHSLTDTCQKYGERTLSVGLKDGADTPSKWLTPACASIDEFLNSDAESMFAPASVVRAASSNMPVPAL